MQPAPNPVFDFVRSVEHFYAALMAYAAPNSQAEPDLGGQLLYVDGLNPADCALIVAANIAGAATIVACDDSAAQRQAIRDGVLDFLVTSLDEAVRILKNELRKRQPVAVCVGLAREAVEAEMRERGLQPGIAKPSAVPEPKALLSQVLLFWSVASAPARWLPRLDALAADCLAPGKLAARRWLRLAPRYLGRKSQNTRVLRCNEAVAGQFIAAVRQRTESGELDVAIEIELEAPGDPGTLVFQPAVPST
jgi:hypothetical protein